MSTSCFVNCSKLVGADQMEKKLTNLVISCPRFLRVGELMTEADSSSLTRMDRFPRLCSGWNCASCSWHSGPLLESAGPVMENSQLPAASAAAAVRSRKWPSVEGKMGADTQVNMSCMRYKIYLFYKWYNSAEASQSVCHNRTVKIWATKTNRAPFRKAGEQGINQGIN